MLYLHCGWPRTSTTSLQTALGRHREQLAASGIVYSQRWVSGPGPTHHGIAVLIARSRKDPTAFNEFKAFLDDCADQDVLFSVEALTFWLQSKPQQDLLLNFLASVQEVVPTRCVWTLRRFDEEACSLYLLWLASGRDDLVPPSRFFERFRDVGTIFDGLRRVERAVGGDVAYVRYDASGGHNAELLCAFDMPTELRRSIRRDLDENPRANVSLTHKQAAALINREALSRASGVELDAVEMRKAFRSKEFEFARDGRCELVDAGVRRALHARALTAARRQRFLPYGEFFGDSEVFGSRSVAMGPEVLEAADLERLVARFGRAPASVGG